MMAGKDPFDRAVRMVDFGIEEAEITFDLGPSLTDDQVDDALQKLDKLEVLGEEEQ